MNHLWEHKFNSAGRPLPEPPLVLTESDHLLTCAGEEVIWQKRWPHKKFFCFALQKHALQNQFCFGFSWPCRALLPGWGCHSPSQTPGSGRWIYLLFPRRTSQLGSSTSFWPVFFPWYPCMHTVSMCTLLYGFLSTSGSRWVGHPQAGNVCRGVPPPCLRRQRWCQQQGGCTSTMLCLGWCVPLLQELISVGGISRYLSLMSYCAV